MRIIAREKVFGPGRSVPLDRNAKARIAAYARAWSARNRQPRQHRGPITRTFLDVLEALLWGFHNSRTGVCFPSYEAIAAKAECCRDTVCEALHDPRDGPKIITREEDRLRTELKDALLTPYHAIRLLSAERGGIEGGPVIRAEMARLMETASDEEGDEAAGEFARVAADMLRMERAAIVADPGLRASLGMGGQVAAVVAVRGLVPA